MKKTENCSSETILVKTEIEEDLLITTADFAKKKRINKKIKTTCNSEKKIEE